MHKWIRLATALLIWTTALPAGAGQGHGTAGHESSDSAADSPTAFEHKAVVDGIRAEFQVMKLADMNIRDAEGNTHHVMVKLIREGTDRTIENAVGRIKVIGPGQEEQIADLKNYSGLLAANFTFSALGKYGVICLFKVDDRKHTVKFWYNHH